MSDFNKKFKDFITNNIIVSRNNSNLFKKVKSSPKRSLNLHADREKTLVCEDQFEKYRFWHLKLCFGIKLMDKCYTEFLLLTVGSYIPLVFLLLYIMSDWKGNSVVGIMQLMYPFWCVTGVIILLIIVNFASKISQKVRG